MRLIALLFLYLFINKVFSQPSTNIKLANSFEEYKLANGLTVYLSENKNVSNIYCSVVCRVGKTDDPVKSPGLTHLLEHMLFKGTPELGTTDWNAEKPHYDKILELYRLLDNETNKLKIADLKKQIKEESLLAEKYIINSEMFGLIKNIGTNYNGITYNEYTNYYNVLSPNMLEKWMSLYSHRFSTPIFRGFVNELDVLSQEYYMRSVSNTNIYDHVQREIFDQVPENKVQELIKETSLSKLIDFYNKFYIANNMGLVIVGNFEKQNVKALIDKYFSTLLPGEMPTHKYNSIPNFDDKFHYKAFRDNSPSRLYCFETMPISDANFPTLKVLLNMLANRNFGLLMSSQPDNKLKKYFEFSLDGSYFGFASLYLNTGSIFGFVKNKRLLLSEIREISKGNFSDTLLTSSKNNLIRNNIVNNENLNFSGETLAEMFALNVDKASVFDYKSKIEAVSREAVIALAREFDSQEPVVLTSRTHSSRKKPKKQLLRSVNNDISSIKSVFATKFDSLKTPFVTPQYISFNEVKDTFVTPTIRLSSSLNPENDVFHLKLRYAPQSLRYTSPKKSFRSYSRALNSLSDSLMLASEFARKSEMVGSKHFISSIGEFSLTIFGYDTIIDQTLKNYSNLISNPKLHEIDKKRSLVDVSILKEWIYRRTSADSISKIIYRKMHTLTEVEYCGSLSLSEVANKLNEHLNIADLYVEKYTHTNELNFILNPTESKVVYEFVPKKCAVDDRFNLQFMNDYLLLKLRDEVHHRQGLATKIDANLYYPKTDSGIPNFKYTLNVAPESVLMVAELAMKVLHQNSDSVMFENAKNVFKSRLMSDLPTNRSTLDKVKKWENNGLKLGFITKDLDQLENLNYSEFVEFYNEIVFKNSIYLRLNGRKSKFGRKEYKVFKQNFENNL